MQSGYDSMYKPVDFAYSAVGLSISVYVDFSKSFLKSLNCQWSSQQLSTWHVIRSLAERTLVAGLVFSLKFRERFITFMYGLVSRLRTQGGKGSGIHWKKLDDVAFLNSIVYHTILVRAYLNNIITWLYNVYMYMYMVCCPRKCIPDPFTPWRLSLKRRLLTCKVYPQIWK